MRRREPKERNESSPLRFVGLLGAAGDGCEYELRYDRFGASYATPRACGDGRPKPRSFADAFPALRPLGRFLRLHGKERVELSEATIDSLVGAVSSVLPGEVAPAFRVGVPGAYRKIVATIPGRGGSSGVFAKLPAHAGGVPAIQREAAVMRRLDDIDLLAGHVPRLSRAVEWHGLPLLVVGSGPTRPGPRRFGTMHRRFLELVHRATARETTFEDSSVLPRWLDYLNTIEADPLWSRESAIFRAAVNHVQEQLSGRPITLCMAHGDFTRWNTRRGPNGLFVFDWEKALDEALPGHDAFYFGSVPRMLHGRPVRRPVSGRGWIDRIANDSGIPVDVAWLAFLIETGLHYVDARVRSPAEGADRIADAVVDEISAWLAVGR